MLKNESNSAIVLCDKCKGSGQVSEQTSHYDDEIIKCEKCGGSGRLLKIEEVRYEKLKDF